MQSFTKSVYHGIWTSSSCFPQYLVFLGMLVKLPTLQQTHFWTNYVNIVDTNLACLRCPLTGDQSKAPGCSRETQISQQFLIQLDSILYITQQVYITFDSTLLVLSETPVAISYSTSIIKVTYQKAAALA